MRFLRTLDPGLLRVDKCRPISALRTLDHAHNTGSLSLLLNQVLVEQGSAAGLHFSDTAPVH